MLLLFSGVKESIFWASWMGNTLWVSWWWRIPAAWLSRSVIDMDLWFLGSAHGVPTNKGCLRWTSIACSESNSFLQWTHLKPNAIGSRWGPSGFPLPAPRRMPSIAFKWLQFSASGQIADGTKQNGTKHNTKKKNTHNPMHCDWCISGMNVHAGRPIAQSECKTTKMSAGCLWN
jgi:hypothetical protein